MKYSDIFKKRIHCNNPDQVFDYTISTLKDTITRWDYFVNWNKAYRNLKEVEIDLNIMNYLIGKANIEDEFKKLMLKHPSIARVIPIVIACRQNCFKILSHFNHNEFSYKEYTFDQKQKYTLSEISDILDFAKSVGFLDLLKKEKIKNLVDYVLGIEVGIDSNGRKNRGGKSMENVVEYFVKDICERNSYQYMKEATSLKIMERWGLILTVDKSSRRIDFALNNNKKLYLIETNFYGGGGSKLKSTAGEYKTMYDFWHRDGHGFIWITDGVGWRTTSRPLRETFDYTDYILNLDMVSHNLLEDIVSRNL